ncbi:DUF2510 domain-containing protein [Microbacterium sp. VKM Ac-2923]|uniref:DUF2510 domain-containing protein n=1 Tax=Microbacterium sp. VKM Ac-2923 TaxID=2929476 RepID=UPI001FB49A19|nr:DUF2510 domain-containing protein [Microbacterium sp. VKM Ac-2923]MCJ1707168.1 DUF2510 domain-containing protein [Microbacterium sp. VKM Ac-2923]
MTDTPTPPDGWYPDPAGGGGLRRWDGTTWTDEVRPVDGSGPTAAHEHNDADSAESPALASDPTAAYEGDRAAEAHDGGALLTPSTPGASVDEHDASPSVAAAYGAGDFDTPSTPGASSSHSEEPAADAESPARSEPYGSAESPAAPTPAVEPAAAPPVDADTTRASEHRAAVDVSGPPASSATPAADVAPTAGAASTTGAAADAAVAGAPSASSTSNPVAPAPRFPAAPAYPGVPASTTSGAPAYPGTASGGLGAYPGAPAVGHSAVLHRDIPTNTVWIWLLVALPLVGVLSLFVFDWGSFIRESVYSSMYADPLATPSMAGTVLTAVSSILSLVLSAATVLFAFLDWRQLRARGIERPFHWAWSFFVLAIGSGIVYIIGRSVIVRRQTGKGLAPLWAAIGVTVLTWILASIWVVVLLTQLFAVVQELQYSYGY